MNRISESLKEHSDGLDPVGMPFPALLISPGESTAFPKWKPALHVLAVLSILLATSGCSDYLARKRLEGVAKGWCETIRASQVIPVYPLTEDLVPGDVFLVQTPIGSQAKLYEKKGFLALDDHRTRLTNIDYKQIYFDGYWKDDFGETPHDRVKLPNPGPLNGTTNPPITDAPAPRAAFPTYSFHAKSGSGLSLAIPIQGVPVGLNFLHSDNADGSVTIADSHTYGADEGQLYQLLKDWMARDDVRQILGGTIHKTNHPIFVRVVSRVYLTGAVVVSLNRSGSTSAGAKVGAAPNVNLTDNNGNINQNYQNILNSLDGQANALSAVTQVGGAIKFASASDSSVALAESFDRPLVIGYLGFDVPVYPGGDIGAPIPTFEHLNRRIAEPPPVRVGPLTADQTRFRANEAALDALAKKDPASAMKVMQYVLDHLTEPEFDDARKVLKDAQPAEGAAPDQRKFNNLLKKYKSAAVDFVTVDNTQGSRYQKYDQVFSAAYDQTTKKP
jgi:hypothetical protein